MVINIQNKETEIKSLSAWDDVLNFCLLYTSDAADE